MAYGGLGGLKQPVLLDMIRNVSAARTPVRRHPVLIYSGLITSLGWTGFRAITPLRSILFSAPDPTFRLCWTRWLDKAVDQTWWLDKAVVKRPRRSFLFESASLERDLLIAI